GRGGALSAAQNDRCPAARDRPETADHREQQGRTEALKEVAVDLARKPAAAVKSGRRRGQRNRDAVGPDEARPDHVGALLSGLQPRLVLTDETRAARDEDAARRPLAAGRGGHSEALRRAQRAGIDAASVFVSRHDLEDTYLPAFRAAIVEGRAGSVMCAYNRVDGQPA